MTSSVVTECVLEVPDSVFTDGNPPSGFGLDVGGTLTKLVYATKKGDSVVFHFVTYSKEELVQSFADMKERMSHCLVPGAKVFTTGLGCNKFRDVINEGLDVEINNTSETDSNAEALKFLIKHLPISQYLYARSESVQPFIDQRLQVFIKMNDMMKNLKSNSVPWKLQLDNKAPNDKNSKLNVQDIFPCLICTLGSGAFYTILEADGTSEMIDINTSCGRMFMGLGSLLTGAKSFDELLALAAAGDDSNVETKCKHVKDNDKPDFYSLLPDDCPVYCFGQTAGRDISEFSREDLAAALVSQLTQHMAESCHLANMSADVKIVFFCGTMCETEQIRAEITKHYALKSVMNHKNINRDFHFIKNGSHLGALGCLLLSMGPRDSNKSAPKQEGK